MHGPGVSSLPLIGQSPQNKFIVCELYAGCMLHLIMNMLTTVYIHKDMGTVYKLAHFRHVIDYLGIIEHGDNSQTSSFQMHACIS